MYRLLYSIKAARFRVPVLLLLLLLVLPALLQAQTTDPTPATNNGQLKFSFGMEGAQDGADVSVAVQLVIVMTVLTLAPTFVMLMTAFTRIVIVMSIVRSAIGLMNAPSNQIIIGLSMFLTFFVMGPVLDRIHAEAFTPYMNKEVTSMEALSKAQAPLMDFMLKQTRTRDLEFFLELGGYGPTAVRDIPLRVVVPAFIISELQTAFMMGFLIYLPFLIIDFIVSTVLMALGMMMMPPSLISVPFKLLLFVIVNGWELVVRSLVESFVL